MTDQPKCAECGAAMIATSRRADRVLVCGDRDACFARQLAARDAALAAIQAWRNDEPYPIRKPYPQVNDWLDRMPNPDEHGRAFLDRLKAAEERAQNWIDISSLAEERVKELERMVDDSEAEKMAEASLKAKYHEERDEARAEAAGLRERIEKLDAHRLAALECAGERERKRRDLEERCRESQRETAVIREAVGNVLASVHQDGPGSPHQPYVAAWDHLKAVMDGPTPHADKLLERVRLLDEIKRETALEYTDARLKYVTVQMDADTWAKLAALEEESDG